MGAEILATGPKTPEGKAVSAKNATRHGLLSRELLQRDERASHLRGLTQRLMVELQPVGELELLLVERVVSCMWRLRRALRVEVEVLEYGRSDFQGEDEGLALAWMRKRDTLASLNRYEVTLERAMYRALHELERQQARRRGEAVSVPAVLDVSLSSSSENTLQADGPSQQVND
jgi:hypothetical protein